MEGSGVSFIKSRLGRLEAGIRGDDRCPVCGLAAGERRPIAVINEEHPEKSCAGDPHERCTRCGLSLYTVLRIVYDSPASEATEGEGGLLG
jgi:hypothetical protein